MIYVVKEGTYEEIDLAVKFRFLTFGGIEEKEAVDNLRDEVKRRYKEEYKKGNMVHFFAYDKAGVPIASAGALIKDDFPYYLFQPGKYGWMIDVYTDPRCRRAGIASKLLEEVHKWLREKGIYESKLIAAGSIAGAVYKKQGYRFTWEMSKSLNHNHQTYNEILDEKDDNLKVYHI